MGRDCFDQKTHLVSQCERHDPQMTQIAQMDRPSAAGCTFQGRDCFGPKNLGLAVTCEKVR